MNVKGVHVGSYAGSQIRRAIIRGSQNTVSCTARELIGSTLFPAYVNFIWKNTESTLRCSRMIVPCWNIVNHNDVEFNVLLTVHLVLISVK
jgi:hypothetical protein